MIYRGPNTAHGRGTASTDGDYLLEIWGQSNAIGRADRTDISASPLTADSELATYDAGTFSRVFIWNGSTFVNLQPSVNNQCDAGQFGVEFGFAVRWMRERAGNLYITQKEAFSGASITYFDTTNWIYDAMITHTLAAMSWLTSNGVTLSGRGWAWIQGETDDTQIQSWYQTRLETLIDKRTTDGVQDSATKRVLVQMATGSAQYGSGVADAKTAVAAASPSNTYAISAPLYMKADNLHQNGRGQVQMAYDVYETLFSASHIAT